MAEALTSHDILRRWCGEPPVLNAGSRLAVRIGDGDETSASDSGFVLLPDEVAAAAGED